MVAFDPQTGRGPNELFRPSSGAPPWTPDGVVFPLAGRHTGDLLLALPAIGWALQHGPVGIDGLRPQYYQAFRALPLRFGLGFPSGRRLKPRPRRGVHATDIWLESLGEGAMPVKVPLALYDDSTAERLLPGTGWIVLSPWSDFEPKRWGVERWRNLAEQVAAAGHPVAIVGPQRAYALAEAIAGQRHLNLAGQDSPLNWPSLLRRASLVVSTDSAPVHVADALGVPVIGLYGHTRLCEYGPYWHRDRCVQAEGMVNLQVDAVMARFASWRAGASA
ncbi:MULTISPECIES: glycosyltransferase family 9 protein [Pseudoxanthomonas]|uniref:Glycosyltransferase family 9 protein n=1 Tax=Pseudoxanthomonas winnipegensis TaxID=2480810 RepID=A0AAW8GI86_9GAMM|nr:MULTISPECIES: glycosyltransferase family 9 protein [Pseudoxanthomonas]MDQ1120691.1 hypothetical protein [Pseudoxanthomonas winnipegensis]MDQ1133915.1 hypothetical protein [Pseudoxanthomonas winnipegensis]MDR6139850.1 hypothetical protein [Pseudoxanthomonas sp. SORGH_AS_0997]